MTRTFQRIWVVLEGGRGWFWWSKESVDLRLAWDFGRTDPAARNMRRGGPGPESS